MLCLAQTSSRTTVCNIAFTVCIYNSTIETIHSLHMSHAVQEHLACLTICTSVAAYPLSLTSSPEEQEEHKGPRICLQTFCGYSLAGLYDAQTQQTLCMPVCVCLMGGLPCCRKCGLSSVLRPETSGSRLTGRHCELCSMQRPRKGHALLPAAFQGPLPARALPKPTR